MKAKLLLFASFSLSFAAQSAAPHDYYGVYTIPSTTRTYGSSQKDCEVEKGTFDEGNKACVFEAENSISIIKNSKDQTIILISVIYAEANIRELSGVVTNAKANVLTISEASIDDNGIADKILKGGCRLILTLENDTALINLGEGCDPDLGRASKAVKN